MSKIFISHSSTDNAAALAIAKWLAACGWDEYFLDITPSRGLVPGERWQEALKSAADRCEAVLFLISPAWQASRWCLAEFLLAKQIGKTIFGVLVETTPLDALPREMTAEWQLCDLVTGTARQSFQVSQEPTVPETEVSFAEDGLMRLRIGLQRAGLDPASFPWPPQSDPNRAPYRGLKALEPEDAAVFFGRESAMVRCLDALRGSRERGVERLFVILGASGAGKSSFLRAGLWPRLMREDVRFLPLPVIRPERAVISGVTGLAASLETAFRERKAGRSRSVITQALHESGGFDRLLAELQTLATSRISFDTTPPTVVISIDQGEELFGAEGRAEAGRFLDLLAETLSPPEGDGPTAVAARQRALAIVAIRSDSYEHLQTEPRLAQVAPYLFSLPPIARVEFKTVVEGPARRHTEAGKTLTVDPALTERLVNETEGADALPLLAFTLERLFVEHGGDGKLVLEDYEALGGVRGSIEVAVNAAFAEPGRAPVVPADKAARERLLRAGFVPWLARVDPDTEERKRRVARWEEIPPEARSLLERLIEQRLLVRDRRKLEGREDVVVVEVAHEALLRQWPTLTAWLDEDAHALKILDAVQRAASEWAKNRKDGGAGEAWLVHTGERLVAAEALRQRSDFEQLLAAVGQSYLDACRSRDERVGKEREARAEAERIAKERELEQAKALAEAQRQRADEQAAARLRQRRLSWGLFTLLALAAGTTFYAWQKQGEAEEQRGVALEERRSAEGALAATERGLLRAQTAELRAMIERLDMLKASGASEGNASAMENLERERQELLARLDKTTRLHQAKLAESMGFRGNLGWLSKWEGDVGGVRALGTSVMIDPNTDLSTADAATIRRRYEFLLSPDEMAAVLTVVGKKGDAAKTAYEEHRSTLERIRLKPTDVAQLVPEAIEPWWQRLVGKYPQLKKESTPGSVQTALLSLAFNAGTGVVLWDPLSPAIAEENWLGLADLIEVSMDSRAAHLGNFYWNLKKRRVEEANLIRTELKVAGNERSLSGSTTAQADDSRVRVIRVVADVLGLDPESIRDASSLKALGADDVDMLVIAEDIAATFNLKIDGEASKKVTTVADWVSYVRERRNESAAARPETAERQQ